MPDLPDSNTLTLAGVLGAALLVEMRLLRRELKLHLGALAERTRRRDSRDRRRRESVPPAHQHGRRVTPRDAVPIFEADDENTDMHELVELERERTRQRRTERPPRPGTHHDRED